MSQTISFDTERLSVRFDSGDHCEMEWSEVAAVAVYRLDLVTRQLLVLELEHESAHVLEVFNDENGWQELLGHVLHRYGLDRERVLPVLEAIDAGDEPFVIYRRQA